jgi:hypothetical protein
VRPSRHPAEDHPQVLIIARLGGDDWDQRIVDWLVTQFKNATAST